MENLGKISVQHFIPLLFIVWSCSPVKEQEALSTENTKDSDTIVTTSDSITNTLNRRSASQYINELIEEQQSNHWSDIKITKEELIQIVIDEINFVCPDEILKNFAVRNVGYNQFEIRYQSKNKTDRSAQWLTSIYKVTFANRSTYELTKIKGFLCN